MAEQIRININKLGVVRNAIITLNQFMIFSGESGLGKSYVAMLVHYVYRILAGETLEEFVSLKGATLKEAASYRDNKYHVVFSFNTKEFLKWLNNEAKRYIQNLLGYSDLEADIEILFPQLPDTLNITCRSMSKADPKSFITVTVNEETYSSIGVDAGILTMVETTVIASTIALYICHKSSFRNKHATLFFPPSRGALMQLSPKDRYNFVQSSPMYKEYMQSLLEIQTSHFAIVSKPIATNKIVNGELVEDGEDFIYKVSNKTLPISATASSIKEIAPLLLLAQKGISSNYSILFEEPESHLHPEMQNAVVDLIAQMINQGTSIQITTHSDYVLRRINDLIYLEKLNATWSRDQYERYCEQKGFNPSVILNPSRIKAYYFKSDQKGFSSVIEQDLSDGIPFDTFATMIDTKFPLSADLYEQYSIAKNND